MPLIFFGHHKAGSTWISGIFKSIADELGKSYIYLDSSEAFDFNLTEFLIKNPYEIITVANAELNCLGGIKPFKGIHVIRDPRDIVVSGYFSHLYSHDLTKDELHSHRSLLKSVSQEDGLIAEMKFDLKFFNNMIDWDYSNPDILEIRYEELVKDQWTQIINIFSHLGLLYTGKIERYILKKYFSALFRFKGYRNTAIPLEFAFRIIHNNSFESLSKGRKAGTENKNSHFRKGVSGDWKNYFTPSVKEHFKQNYNHILIRLGYETNDQW